MLGIPKVVVEAITVSQEITKQNIRPSMTLVEFREVMAKESHNIAQRVGVEHGRGQYIEMMNAYRAGQYDFLVCIEAERLNVKLTIE